MVVSSRSIDLSLYFRGRLFPPHRLSDDGRLCGRRLAWDGDAFCIDPQPFECVMISDILPEYMGDDIAVVHQNPLGGPCAFDAQRFGPNAREDTVSMIGDGTRLAIRIRRTYDQVVGNGGQRRYLEAKNVGGLLIEHGPGNGEAHEPSCSCDYGPLGRDDAEVYKIPLRAATDLRPGALDAADRECSMRKLHRAGV